MIHTVKDFGIVNKAEVDIFLELSCFFDDPVDVGSLISGSSAFSKAAWTFGSSWFTGLSGTVYSGALAHLLGAVPCGYLHVVSVLCSKTKACASGAAGMVGGQTVLHLPILLWLQLDSTPYKFRLSTPYKIWLQICLIDCKALSNKGF